ncbi:hypothetical protein SEUCBS140593_001509 [Sporothrix eucalyptigena]|uniref:Uncharacterized protein n=1 Tax=Sporothrix eucalyptigena TaxID=1812306 RepID=A0ABP0AYS2_9PEZI
MAEEVPISGVTGVGVVSAPAPADKQDTPSDDTTPLDSPSPNKTSAETVTEPVIESTKSECKIEVVAEPAAEPVPTKQPVHISIAPKSNTEFSTDAPTAAAPAGYKPLKSSSHHRTTFGLDNYFSGPRDISKHSKWPLFLQMHGSILPRLIVPLFFLGGWATAITCITKFTSVNLGISNTILTITGFVVGMSLSFRSSTAYERYSEGRRYWAQLIFVSNNLARVIWYHAKTRPDHKEKDTLAKLTAMKLLVAFAVALKHKLRFEPYTDYEDLAGFVGHIDTYAGEATRYDPGRVPEDKGQGFFKTVGESLGLSMAVSNPRKAIKRSQRPLGNLPLEIINYLACFADELTDNWQLEKPHFNPLYNNITALNEILIGTERVLTTPLPIAYAIAINQITWLYVFLLPFQLLNSLDWVTIPATLAAGYIILGLLFIGREVENPFGDDVNDLPLDTYCAQIANEVDLVASRPKPTVADWIQKMDNKVLWPMSSSGYNVWESRGVEEMYTALRTKFESGCNGIDKGRGGAGAETINIENNGKHQTSVRESEKPHPSKTEETV